MPRIRSLKHEFFLNQELANISAHGRLLFQGLWLLADREGRLKDRPGQIKAQIFPYEQVDVDDLLNQLSCGFITRYKVGGEAYLQIINFRKHQRPNSKEAPSEIPPPSKKRHEKDFHGLQSVKIQNEGIRERKGKEGEGSGGVDGTKQGRFVQPTMDQVKNYCTERNNGVDPQKWIDHYQSNGWKVGKNAMKDWKAAVRTWEKNEFRNGDTPRQGGSLPGLCKNCRVVHPGQKDCPIPELVKTGKAEYEPW